MASETGRPDDQGGQSLLTALDPVKPSGDDSPLPAPAIWLARALTAVVCLLIFAMMALVFFDVLGRYLFSSPITGAFEIIEFLLALLIFAGLPLVTMSRSHITIGMFDDVARGRGKWLQQGLIALCSAGALLFIAERLLRQAQDMEAAQKITGYLETPVAPVVYVLALLAFLSFLLQLFLIWQLIRRYPEPWPPPRGDDDLSDLEKLEDI